MSELHETHNHELQEGSEPLESGLGLFYEITVYNKDGTVKEHRREPAHSFTHNFYTMVECLFRNGCGYNTVNLSEFIATDGNSVEGASYPTDASLTQAGCTAGGFPCNAGSEDSNYGIVVGTSSDGAKTDPNGWKYDLGVRIEHGIGPGSLTYDEVQQFPDELIFDDADPIRMKFKLHRLFTNESVDPDASITIGEIGIINRMNHPEDKYILTVYDAISPINLNSEETLGVVYEIQIN